MENGRRHDLDWLRLIALCLLIPYHVLLVFSLNDFLVKHPNPGIWADHIAALLTPWRMPLVFLIGGAALRYFMEKVGPVALMRDRALRLLPPFVLTVLVLAPPAAYVSALEHGKFAGSFWAYLQHDAWRAVHYHGLAMPAQQHVWFLPYLLSYTIAGALVAHAAPGVLERAQRLIEHRLSGWMLIAAAAAWFTLIDGALTPFHQRALLIFTDITGHLLFAPVFALGFVMARSAPMWSFLRASWRPLALLGGVLMVMLLALRLVSHDTFAVGVVAMPLGAVSGVYGAVMVMAIVGVGAAKLNRPSPFVTYMTDAILPVYILHMIFLVLSAYMMRLAHWTAPEAVASLLVIAFVGPLATYEVLIRRFTPMRFLFGLKRAPRAHDSVVRAAESRAALKPFKDAGAL